MTWHEANFIFQVNYPPKDGIFKPIPAIYCKYSIYKYDQIQSNVRFILIQLNM